MVSPLWLACSGGDVDKVHELLKGSSNIDIEVRDHAGVTPLIEAIKNGHVEIVRLLLDFGADPVSSLSQGRLEQYTSHLVIIDLVRQAQNKTIPRENNPHENNYQQGLPEDIDKRFYSHPQGSYPYYPTLNTAPSPLADGGSTYYPPLPPHGPSENPALGGLSNLPPPEIARSIPCRYFPACRYGSSCMFAHPQTPYPAPPPGQYIPYDPSLGPQSYGSGYYPVPPPTFQQPNGVPHMAPLSPPPGPPPLVHGRSHSDVVPPTPNPYTPGGLSPLPYGSMLPPVYPPQGQIPMSVPMSHPQPPMPPPVPQSPTVMYGQPPMPNPVYNGQPDGNGPYPPPPPNVPIFTHGPPMQRDGMPHGRRGGGRGSFNSRKPPCIFYPSGRCKNGDECRFPHVLPDGSGNQNTSHYPNRNGARTRGNSGVNGFPGIDEKLANLNIRDDQIRQDRSGDNNAGHGGRAKFDRGSKNHHGGSANGSHASKKLVVTKQRVPDADEFPVLGGSVTPPNRQPNGMANGAPTAAQVLQAPPPIRKETSQTSTRGPSPDSFKSNGTKESVGTTPEAIDSPVILEQKLPISFAAAASNADLSKEVAVSA
ncbi:hypothetical protein F5887DRAFT_1058981 [Amanita rubescens]|nr:hypothetical protein F5887DRAFT_1058981 [Amanita rubescens]